MTKKYEIDHYLLKVDLTYMYMYLFKQIAKSLLSKAHTQLKQAVSSADEVKDQVKNKDSITTAYMAFVSFCDNILRQKDAGKWLLPRKFERGESIVAAIMPSRMEVSYCTSGFFCS